MSVATLSPFSTGLLTLGPWRQLDPSIKISALKRPQKTGLLDPTESVKAIIAKVRQEGDRALRTYGILFDRWQGSWIEDPLEVPQKLWSQALQKITPAQLQAMERAADQIRRFHEAQAPKDYQMTVSPGIICGRRLRPIEAVGIYVPAGHAPLPSSLLMAAVPARIAGCKQRIVCTPARPDGTVHPGILAAAAVAEVTALYRVGGAHSIAAMAYGTGEIPKVDKIFGPGNSYVTAAKIWCSLDPMGAALDMPAGPSEVMVVADATARPEFVAADLLSQAEHGTDSHVVLVVRELSLEAPIVAALENQLRWLESECPDSFLRARASLNAGVVLYADDEESCLDIINRYAPEHLILQVKDPSKLADKVSHAGSIFLGLWTPESLGDYASGTNHVLPTYGTARSLSGLGLEAFFKSTTIQEATPEGLLDLGPTVLELAGLEGLAAHGEAVRIRLKSLAEEGSQPMQTPSSRTPHVWTPWELARPSVKSMVGYQSARSLQAMSQDQSYLDANEFPWDPIDGRVLGINRYPDPQPRELTEFLANFYGVNPQNLMVTAGADQGIDVLIRAFCEAFQNKILITPPTYGYYEVCAALQGCSVVRVPLVVEGVEFKLDSGGIQTAVSTAKDREIKLVFICSPNNPTGMGFGAPELRSLAQNLAPHALLVVDEAYLEFTDKPSVASLVETEPNLVVLRTLSKAFGLAGLRIGSLIAHSSVIKGLQSVRPPYPLSQASVDQALRSLNTAHLTQAIQGNTQRRELLRFVLEQSSLVEEVFPSETNFLLVRCRNSSDLLRRSSINHLVIRDRSGEPNLQNCVRITVGSPQEILQLKKALQP